MRQSPLNTFFYCLLVRREQLTQLNTHIDIRIKNSIQKRFYNIHERRFHLQLTYPITMLRHAMNPYKHRSVKGKVSKLERVEPFYIYQKECTKKE